MTIQIIGDVIEFDGYQAARIGPNITASARARFENFIQEIAEEDSGKVDPEELIEAMEALETKAQAGLISIEELSEFTKNLRSEWIKS